MAAIINSGFALITSNLQAGLPTIISEFVLADIPTLDHTLPIDDAEVMPTLGEISWRGPVTRAAAIQPDKVVYSLLLDGSVGDFNFNWIGLVADNGTLVAVAYVPRQQKFKYDANVMGNTITRNFVLAFAGAQGALNITISPETWQFDFTDHIEQRIQEKLDALISPALEQIEQQVEQALVRVNDAIKVEMVLVNSTAAGNTRHLFMAPAMLQLEAAPDGQSILVAADHSLNVNLSDCFINAPVGEMIQTAQGPASHCRLAVNNQEFRFNRINGEWRV